MGDKLRLEVKNEAKAIKTATKHFKVDASERVIDLVDEIKNAKGVVKKIVVDAYVQSNETVSDVVENAEVTVENDVKEIENTVEKTVQNAEVKSYEPLEQYIQKILGHLGLVGTTEIEVVESQVRINIDSDNNSKLIGKSGSTLNAINLLVKQVAHGIYGKSEKRIDYIVDAGNYKQERIEKLKSLATNMADKVNRYGKSVKLKPMNAYERRIIHATICEIGGLETVSVGQEPARYIIIKPV